VQLINWSGAIFGPGSEWFWAFAQFIVVVATLFGIYRQLRSAGAANAIQRIETLEGQWASPRMLYQRLDLAVHLKTHPADLEGFIKAKPILDFFTNLENLWMAGYLSALEINHNFGTSIEVWTGLTKSVVALRREAESGPLLYDFEPLIRELRIIDRKLGKAVPVVDDESTPDLLDYAIAVNTSALKQDAAWRSGVLPAVPDAASPSA
jgi:hypothetical protein